MPADSVVDASVLAAAFFREEFEVEANRFLTSDIGLSAPHLLTSEIASVASKKVRKREVSREGGRRAMRDLGRLIDNWWPVAPLAERAFEIAGTSRISAYDATYLALAERLDATMATLDAKLLEQATEVGLGHLVNLISLQRP